MKYGTILVSNLGANCWAAAKVLNDCLGCTSYDTCRYPDRKRNSEYDRLRDDAAAAHRLYKQAVQRANNYRDGITTAEFRPQPGPGQRPTPEPYLYQDRRIAKTQE